MENLIVELNGVRHLIMECPFTDGNKDKLEGRCNRHGVIIQGIIKLDKGGWFSPPIIVLRVLVPEQNVWAWNIDSE